MSNFFQVIETDIGDHDQLAFAVNLETFDIIIGRSGHGKLLRGRDKRDWAGGWIFRGQGKITFYSGTLGSVDHYRDLIADCLINHLRQPLRLV